MRYLLDTCVISELAKPEPNEKVVAWATQNDEENFYLSTLTFGEFHKGVSNLPPANSFSMRPYPKDCCPLDRVDIQPPNVEYSNDWG